MTLRQETDRGTTGISHVVSGQNFQTSCSYVDIVIDNSFTTGADANGRFVVPGFLVDELAPGPHQVVATTFDPNTFEFVDVVADFTIDADAPDTTPPTVVPVLLSSDDSTSTGFGNAGTDPSTGEDVNDPAGVVFTLDVPTNARGFELDLMSVSTEWPEFLCQSFNDALKVIVESAEVENGAPTNVAFESNGNPLTVNVGFFEFPADWTTDLTEVPQATPLDQLEEACPEPSFTDETCTLPAYCSDGSDIDFVGSGSGWLKTRAPVRPGERLRLTLLVYDVADDVLDSVGFLDGFRWLADTPPIETVKEP